MSRASKRVRFLAPLVAVAAMLVMAVGASAASALEWSIEGHPLTSTTETETVASENAPGSEFTLADSALGVTTKCATEKDTGKIIGGNPGTDEATIEFTKCTVSGFSGSGCTVEEPIVTHAKTALLEELGVRYDRFTPSVGSTFVELNYLGSCLAKGTHPVTGYAQGKLNPQTGEVVRGKLEFTSSSGSKLEVSGTSATFEGITEVWLTGPNTGKKWGVI